MNTYLTSDTHFRHENIIKFCNRPWLNVDEMTEALIAKWNARVRHEDRVYHLGDFALGKDWKLHTPAIVKRLNGYKIIILGNHDRSVDAMYAAGFNEVCRYLDIEMDGKRVHMRHEPNFLEPQHPDSHTRCDDSTNSDIFLHGHVHQSWRRRGKHINVGVDVWDYQPVTLEEALAAPDEL